MVILLSLGFFLFAKTVFRLPHSNVLLYTYGVTVTSVVFVQLFVAMVLYRDPALTKSAAEAMAVDDHGGGLKVLPGVSCLVAVHNEEEIIDQCVRSLAHQTYENVEIIFIDDASTDGTLVRLRELAQEYPIRVLALDDNVGKKCALGKGMLEASGEIFAFSDSDSTWAPDAISKAVQILQSHPEVGAISGHCRAMNANQNLLTRMQDTWYEGQFSVRKAFESMFGAVTCVSGPLAVFRREAIFNYIPAWEKDRFLGDEFRFATDRTLTGFVLMDPRSSQRLKSRAEDSPFLTVDYPWKKWKIVYSKSMRSWTVVPATFKAVLRQQARWKKSFVRNIFFTGRFYWRQAIPPALIYYVHVFFVFAGPLIAFRHLIYLPLHGNIESMLLYLFGILFIGMMFGLAFRREDPAERQRWFYRPLMSLMSTVVLSWLIAYSLATIKKMTWARG